MIRHSGRQVYKVGAGATESLLVAGYVTKPMISRPVRMELLAGAAAGLVYDIATQSSGSSSERNGTHVGPGGTPYLDIQQPRRVRAGIGTKYETRYRCPKGYELRKIDGRWLCVREKR